MTCVTVDGIGQSTGMKMGIMTGKAIDGAGQSTRRLEFMTGSTVDGIGQSTST